MTTRKPRKRSPATPAPDPDRPGYAASVGRLLSGAVRTGRRGATLLVGRLPGTTSALQTLPDSTLLGLSATSAGLGAGFYLARAPRLVVAAGILPALMMGAAIVLRPISRRPPGRMT